MNQRDEHTELIALIESVINNSASDHEVQRLDAMLDADAAARTIYLDYIDLHAGLRRRFAHPLPESEPAGADEFRPVRADGAQSVVSAGMGRSKRAWRALGLLALAACVPLTVAVVPGRQSAPPGGDAVSATEISPDQEASLAGVAVLSRAVDVEWFGKRTEYSEGAAIPASKLKIASGVLQLEFYSGAVAVLEGPAEIDLIDAMSACLHSGKLRARVPPQARGFTISTKNGEVVDLGTEFAIDQGPDREWGELHVIDGEVRYDPTRDSGYASRQVFGGEAMRLGVDHSQEDSEIELTTDRFIGPAEIETISRERKTQRHREWREWRSRFLSDPSLVAMYGYSPEPEWSRTLRNYAPNGPQDSHGVIIGCDWESGRWPGQRSVCFRNASHRVSIDLSGEYESLTLAAWVLIERFHPSNQVALMHPETKQQRVVHWTLDRVPEGALVHFSESTGGWSPDSRRLHYSSIVRGLDNKDAGRWVHIVTVYDSTLERVSHYRDGKLISWKPIDETRPLSIGIADIGNWPYRDWAKGTKFETRNLIGRIDEFVVMGRAMAGKELVEMYEVGKP